MKTLENVSTYYCDMTDKELEWRMHCVKQAISLAKMGAVRFHQAKLMHLEAELSDMEFEKTERARAVQYFA